VKRDGPENRSGRRREQGRASNLFQTRDENTSGEWKWQQSRAPHVALCMLPMRAIEAGLSFSERPDRNRTPIPESLQWLSTALSLTLTSD
jgi:hypothetical protein